MNRPALIVALDHELYFGAAPGSIERCLLEPVDALLTETAAKGFKLTLFVDAGMLPKLKQQPGGKEYSRVAEHLRSLYRSGHDVQLHIHPHWEDSTITDGVAQFDTTRYRLHDFTPKAINEVVRDYKAELEHVIEAPVTAYRAGGWCIQPFAAIAEALAQNGVTIDSTVYSGGVSQDTGREFDFRHAPDLDHWRFEEDPGKPQADGRFLELPITPVALSPVYYFQNEILRRLRPAQHRNFGDGAYLAHDSSYYLEKLKPRSISPASIDGYKASRLMQAYRHVKRRGGELVNVMGHPKAISPTSIRKLADFLDAKLVEPVRLRDYAASVAG